MDDEKLVWAAIGGAIVWWLMHKPCGCHATDTTASTAPSSAAAAPTPYTRPAACWGGMTCAGTAR